MFIIANLKLSAPLPLIPSPYSPIAPIWTALEGIAIVSELPYSYSSLLIPGHDLCKNKVNKFYRFPFLKKSDLFQFLRFVCFGLWLVIGSCKCIFNTMFVLCGISWFGQHISCGLPWFFSKINVFSPCMCMFKAFLNNWQQILFLKNSTVT